MSAELAAKETKAAYDFAEKASKYFLGGRQVNREVMKRWVSAGIVLAKDPTADVACPVCEMANLLVRDIRRGAGSAEFERLLICPSCGAKNALRMNDDVT